MNVYDGDGRKNPNNEKTKSRKRFSPFGCPPIPRLRNGDRLFSGVRKQAEPTLGGRGILA